MSSKAEAKVDEHTTLEVDFSAMEQRLLERVDKAYKPMMERYFKELKEDREAKKGKGVVEAFTDDDKARNKKVVEEFQKGENCDPVKIKEQWTICIPKYATYELAGHLRDFVWVTDVLKGRPGDTVNIPTVRDVDFEHAGTPGSSAWAGVAGLINVITATLHESGTYYDAFYYDIERIDSNMLEELNRVFAHAAVRAEDHDLVALLCTATTGQFESYGGVTHTNAHGVSHIGTTGATALGYAHIIEALVVLAGRGKEVHPGECILYCNPLGYGQLINDIAASTPAMYARPDILQKGFLEDFLGVKIMVGGKRAFSELTQVLGTTYDAAFLFRPKRALALAPKRDILIETDKLIKDRQLRIAASHTYAVRQIDMTEVVCIKLGGNVSLHA